MAIESVEVHKNCLRAVGVFEQVVIELNALVVEISMGGILCLEKARRGGLMLPCREDFLIIFRPFCF